MFRSELAIPAGSLQCALYAFKGGADAVYLGLKQFSARKGAVNFTFEELRKLKKVCISQNKKFYITLNTLISDEQMPQAIELLRQLDYLEPDGVIVQDLGIASVIRDHFPKLSLHGSTQLAVHTIEGVKELQDLGFSRVVLSRELSFEEIAKIRKACPDIELKVFIHGALCFGFSGLCMASQQLTGRSANCGECAQICRTWFSCKETSSKGWFFSMKDLCLGEKVRKLQDLGIESLKVEGRMKSPQYCYWTSRYYRMILDGISESDSLVLQAKEAMQVSFSRETTEGFFENDGKTLICSDFPSHRGIPVGIVRKVMNRRIEILFTKPVALRDGLLVISGSENAGFAFNNPDSHKSFAAAGESVEVDFPSDKFKSKPKQGTTVWCTSRHNLNAELLNENLSLYSKPMNLKIEINKDGLVLNSKVFSADVQESRNDTDINEVFTKVFSASDKSLFTLGNLEVINKSGFESPFIPMSVLKEIRRSYYADADEAFFSSNLNFERPENQESKLADRSSLGDFDKVITVDGKDCICLCPLMFNEEAYFSKLDSLTRENTSILIGLNNIAQVRWAKKHPEIKVFADYFLYTKNSYSFDLLKRELPNLIGRYGFDENSSFEVPVFVSRVCFRRNGLNLDCRGCSRNNSYTIEQNGKTFKVICRDCITTVYKENSI